MENQLMDLPLKIAPLIILVPFVAFVILMTAGAWPKKLWHKAHLVGIVGIASSWIMSVIVALRVHEATEAGLREGLRLLPAVSHFTWAPMGLEKLTMGFQLDGLAAVMLLVVTTVATMVQIYSIGYMHGDPRYSRFYAYLSLFSAAMLGLVLANNILQLYIFWELVGLSSYLLIGFWFEKPEAMRAAKKAFIVTRLGDIGFFIGLLMLYAHAQALDYVTVFSKLGIIHQGAPFALTAIALLLFCGAVGKSAQFPLHVWLPDAMEGPTPVSALIHAATMVAAGVYLVGRMFPLFKAADVPWQPAIAGMTLFSATPLQFVAAIGAITALLGATIGVLQNDIKRVLAYSTISQLGYMMAGLGVGGYVAGLFHLTTHAFFKALLFLGSGSVIHGTGTQDMWRMGGLRKKMPKTFVTFMIGTLALAGVPFLFSGFYSKEEILSAAAGSSPVVFWMLVAGAFLTAFYMTRLIYLTFFGEPRDHTIHAHESPLNMTGPLMFLAALSVGWPGLFGLAEKLGEFIDPMKQTIEAPHIPWVGWVGMGAALGGIAVGILVYWMLSPSFRQALIRLPIVGKDLIPGGAAPGVYTWVKNKYYFDEFYWKILVVPMFLVSTVAFWVDRNLVDITVNAVGFFTRAFAEIQAWIDKNVVDGLVNAVGWVTGRVGRGFRRAQTGLVQNYALIAVVGLVAIVSVYLYLGF